ncbi:MAG: O-antigen ligase family protein, partial [Elusimicrobiota bacterium]|nr:O-antigen ligase family protein [Elusimicrobiota bacterium]
MAWAAVVVSLYAILQSFLGLHTTMSLRLPDETIMMVKPRDEVVMTVLGWPVRMGTGIMGIHLTYGGQIMMMSFFVWAVFKKKWPFALTVVSLLLSFAYSAWLGFVAALSLFYGFRKKTAKYAVLLLVLFFTVLFTVPGNRQKVMHKLTDRMRIWNISLEMYSTNPVFGIGPKRFKYIYEDKYLENESDTHLGHSHSVYLDLLTEGGPLTFLSFLFFVWRFLKKYGKRVKGKHRNLHTASLLALLGIAVASFFQNYHTAAENSVLIWIIIGITVKLKLLEKEKTNKSR